MALKNNKTKKLSKAQEAQIQRDSTLLKNFLFDLIDELYKDLKLITRPFYYKRDDKSQKGNFIFNFDLLTKLELVNIILESMIETASKSRGSWICIGKLGNMVEEKLCNTKYLVLESNSGNYGKLHSSDFAGMVPDLFRRDLCDRLLNVAIKDENIADIEELIHHSYYPFCNEILKESNDSKPIILKLRLTEFEVVDLNSGEYITSAEGVHYISFLAFKGESKTRRTIRIENLSINPL